MRDSRVRARYGVSVCRSRARVLTLFCPRTPSSWTGAPRTLSWPRPTGPRAGRPRRSPSRSAASGMNHRGTSLQVPTSLSTSSRLSCQGVRALLIQLLCWRVLAFQNTEMLFDISASPKRNAMTVEGRTEEGRTCAPRDRRLWQRDTREREPLANKVSGHSVGRGGAVRNTRTPPLSPRRPSRSAREASFRKWLQKHESFVVGVVGPRPFSRWPCSLAPPTAKRNANVWSGSDALSVSLSLHSLTSAARSGLTRDSQSV